MRKARKEEIQPSTKSRKSSSLKTLSTAESQSMESNTLSKSV